MSIRDRVLLYLDYKSISKYRFYKVTGLSNGFLDKEGSIGSDKCLIICSYYSDINPEWLLMGVGNMLKNKVSALSRNTTEADLKLSVKYLSDKVNELTAENESLKLQISALKSYNTEFNPRMDITDVSEYSIREPKKK